jgi:hypothetical protein
MCSILTLEYVELSAFPDEAHHYYWLIERNNFSHQHSVNFRYSRDNLLTYLAAVDSQFKWNRPKNGGLLSLAHLDSNSTHTQLPK